MIGVSGTSLYFLNYPIWLPYLVYAHIKRYTTVPNSQEPDNFVSEGEDDYSVKLLTNLGLACGLNMVPFSTEYFIILAVVTFRFVSCGFAFFYYAVALFSYF